ncbi:MAG: hypothetical protein WBB76_11065 [Gaiellaceae bacterium]
MSAALDSRDRRAVEHLLADCAVLDEMEEAAPRRPIFERLRERVGVDLARRLLYALTGVHRTRSPRGPA